MSALLEIDGLTLELVGGAGVAPLVRDFSLDVRAGEVLALVGESGAGKSLVSLAVFGLLPSNVRVARGAIRWRGIELATLEPGARRALYGRELALSFQEPKTALNPVLRAGEQIAESLRFHAGLSRRAADERAVALLAELGLAEPASAARAYPHELSGGQRLRALLALALACGPALLIADEPTSALDAALATEVLALLIGLVRQREMALLWITHDLTAAAAHADRVAVMYAGQKVEEAPARDLFAAPRHPYAAGLLRANERGPTGAYAAIAGHAPALTFRPSGCAFHPRCARADERCRAEVPAFVRAQSPGRGVACHHPLEGEA
jgi:oligopeptide/dipeptide ABC transporter ATP-binding protein